MASEMDATAANANPSLAARPVGGAQDLASSDALLRPAALPPPPSPSQPHAQQQQQLPGEQQLQGRLPQNGVLSHTHAMKPHDQPQHGLLGHPPHMRPHRQQHLQQQHDEQHLLQQDQRNGVQGQQPQQPLQQQQQVAQQLAQQLAHQHQRQTSNQQHDSSFFVPYSTHQYHHQQYYPGPPAPFYSQVPPPYFAHAPPYMLQQPLSTTTTHHQGASSPIVASSFPSPQHQHQPQQHPHQQARLYDQMHNFSGVYDPSKKTLIDGGLHRTSQQVHFQSHLHHHGIRQHQQGFQGHHHPHQHHRPYSTYGLIPSAIPGILGSTGAVGGGNSGATAASASASRRSRDRSSGTSPLGHRARNSAEHGGRSGHGSHGVHHADHRGHHHVTSFASGGGQQFASPQDELVAQLDTSAAEAVNHGDPVMLSLLVTSWANSLSEAAADNVLASSEARSFEAVFAASNALKIVTRYILFGMVSLSMSKSTAQSTGADETIPSSEGATVGDLSPVQKSLVSLNRRVLYGDETMHENLTRLASGASPRLSSSAVEILEGYLASLRSLATDVRISDTLRWDDDNLATLQETVGSAADHPNTRHTAAEQSDNQDIFPQYERLMRPWRIAIARLHNELSAVIILRDALDNLANILPVPDENGDTGIVLTGRLTDSRRRGVAPSASCDEGSENLNSSTGSTVETPGNNAMLTELDQTFLKDVYDTVERRLRADIIERSDVIREKWWPALAHDAGSAICQAVSERVAERISRLESISTKINSQIRSMALGFGSTSPVSPCKHSDLVAVVQAVANLVEEHSSAVDAAESASNQMDVLLSSLRAIGVSSVKSGVAPPIRALKLFYRNVASAYSGLDDVRAWSFAALHSKVTGCLRKSSQPRQRALRFEEPSCDTGDGRTEGGSPDENASVDDHFGVSPAGSSATGSAQRHKPRHVRMKSSPDELLNLHMRLDNSDEDEEYIGSVEPEFRRQSPGPGMSGGPLAARRLSGPAAGARRSSIEEKDIPGPGATGDQVSRPSPGLSGTAGDDDRIASSSDDDDGMIVHDDAHEGEAPPDEKSHRSGILVCDPRSKGPASFVSASKPPTGATVSYSPGTDAECAVRMNSSGGKGCTSGISFPTGLVAPTSLDVASGSNRSKGSRVTFEVDASARPPRSCGGDDDEASGESLRDEDEIVADKGEERTSPQRSRSPNAAGRAAHQSSPGNPHMRSMSVDNIGPF